MKTTASLPLAFGAAAIFLLAAALPSGANAGAADDLLKAFDTTCVANAGKSPEFATSRIEKAFNGAKRATALRVWWKQAQSCRVEFHALQALTRSPELSAAFEKKVSGFAGRVGGSVTLKRKGKRNEYYVIKSPAGTYTMEMLADRDNKVTGMNIGRR